MSYVCRGIIHELRLRLYSSQPLDFICNRALRSAPNERALQDQKPHDVNVRFGLGNL